MSQGGTWDELRVDQVGSLLRPSVLKDAWARHDRGDIGASELGGQERKAVESVIAEQERRGVLPIVDGEFWRRGFQETFGNSVSGYLPPPPAANTGPSDGGQIPESTYVRRQAAQDRLQLSKNVLLEEYAADRVFTQRPFKVTLTGPERLTQRFDLRVLGSASTKASTSSWATSCASNVR